MQIQNVTNRFTSLSKVAKLNVFLLTLLMIATTMAVSFAANGGTNAPDCGAHVALVLDRSSSIGVDRFSGSRAQSDANISAIKVGANVFVDAVQGPDSYTDVYAFASVAQRINTGGWFNVKDQTNANWQKMVIGGLKFKQGPDSSSENAYNDGMLGGSEGLTNWHGALNLVGASRQDPFPTHIVMFTDGNPTTNQDEVDAALRAGGSFRAAGNPNVDGVDADDISTAVRSAEFLRAIGIKIIPVAVGGEDRVNMANLQALAGPGNPVYRANNYSQLTAQFMAAAANVCQQPVPPSKIGFVATDADTGAFIPAKINIADSPFGASVQTRGPGTTGFNYATATPDKNWGFKSTLDLSSVPSYELKNVYCRSGAWSTNSPTVGVKTAGGINSDPNGYVPGTIIRCEYLLSKKFVPDGGIELVKTVNPVKAKRGDEVTYSFVVKNTGNTKLSNIKINDPKLGGSVGTIETLEVGASSAPITKKYTIPADAIDTIHNVATVTGTPVNPGGPDLDEVSDTDDADVVVELREGSEIEKSVSPSVATIGTEVTYTIKVKNTGETTLSNVLVSDVSLEKELTIAGPIAPGETEAIDFKYTIKDGDFENGIFTNIACLKGTETCDDARVIEPKVELIKTGPTSARPGETVTYKFKVKNTGIADLTNIKIKDETLSKFTSAPVVIDVDGTLEPGESSDTLTYEFKIPSDFEGNVFDNVAIVHANPIDPDTDTPVTDIDVSDDDDHSIAIIRWTATKTADKDVVVPGTTVTYTITVTNTGGAVLENIQVSDPTIGFPQDGKPVVIETLGVGESKTITANYVIPSTFEGNTFKNVVLVCIVDILDPTNKQDDVNTSTNSDDCKEPSTTVDVARISLVKTVDKETAFPGETVVYTFVVTNTGAVDIDPTMINDDVLGEIGDPEVLAPGESATFTKEYTVDEQAQDSSEIHNTVTVCAPVPGTQPADNQADDVTTNTDVTVDDETTEQDSVNTDCSTTCPEDSLTTLCAQDDHTLVIVIPSITIDKTADLSSAGVGDTVTYTFLVTNTSSVELTDISVTDNVLGDLGTIEKLGPGESATKTITYIVPDDAATEGTVRNVVTACFEVPQYDDNCASDDHTLSVVAVGGITIARPADTAGPSLPFTGAQSAWLALIAGLITGLGVTLHMMTRRRRGELA